MIARSSPRLRGGGRTSGGLLSARRGETTEFSEALESYRRGGYLGSYLRESGEGRRLSEGRVRSSLRRSSRNRLGSSRTGRPLSRSKSLSLSR